MAPSPRLSPLLLLLLAAASLAAAAEGAVDATAAAAAAPASEASEAASEAAKPPPQPHTLVALTAKTFDSATAEGLWIIEFYAPWCAHCKALEPVLREAAVALGPALLFGQVRARVRHCSWRRLTRILVLFYSSSTYSRLTPLLASLRVGIAPLRCCCSSGFRWTPRRTVPWPRRTASRATPRYSGAAAAAAQVVAAQAVGQVPRRRCGRTRARARRRASRDSPSG